MIITIIMILMKKMILSVFMVFNDHDKIGGTLFMFHWFLLLLSDLALEKQF